MAGEVKSSGRLFDLVYILVVALLVAVGVMYMQRPKVAVVDINRVAAELGFTERAKAAVAERQKRGEARIQKLSKELDPNADDLAAKIKAAKSDEERQPLVRKLQEIHGSFQQQITRERESLQGYRLQIIRTFRERLQPHVGRVAASKGADVVLERQGVFVVRGRVDITAAVIAAARPAFPADLPLVDREIPEGAVPEAGAATTNAPPLAPHIP